MDKPLMLKIGDWNTALERPAPVHQDQAAPSARNEAAVSNRPSSVADTAASPASESLAAIYEVLKRHEETIRDLVVEVRLQYYNLPDKEKQRVEGLRARTAYEVGEIFAGQIRVLDEMIAKLRGNR